MGALKPSNALTLVVWKYTYRLFRKHQQFLEGAVGQACHRAVAGQTESLCCDAAAVCNDAAHLTFKQKRWCQTMGEWETLAQNPAGPLNIYLPPTEGTAI